MYRYNIWSIRRKDETITQKSTWGQFLLDAGKLSIRLFSDAVSRDWPRPRKRHRWRTVRTTNPVRPAGIFPACFPAPVGFGPGLAKSSIFAVTLVYTPKDIYGRQWTRKNYLRREELRSRRPSQPCPGSWKRVDKQWLTDIFFLSSSPRSSLFLFPLLSIAAQKYRLGSRVLFYQKYRFVLSHFAL